jgi:NSS family neurotransmitter:Na+ symporter
MPAMFVLLLILVGYAATTSGFGQSLAFLFSPDFSKLTAKGMLEALGHAFFTLSLGLAIMLAYGSYLPKHYSIGRTALTVAFLDTLVALLAGVAIFSVVFTNSLEPSAGPGLVFQTLPLSFAHMPSGTVVGIFFFFMLLFAAWSSAISITEPAVSSFMERFNSSRKTAALVVGVSAWAIGVAAALSFNVLADIKIINRSIFDFLDYLTTNIMLPLGCMITAVFVGWALPSERSRSALPQMSAGQHKVWLFVLRYISPVLIAIIFFTNLA